MADSVYKRFGSSALVGSGQTQQQHTVIAGDTLSRIAAQHYRSGYDSELWRQIAEANAIDDLDAITTNTVLVIPTPKAVGT